MRRLDELSNEERALLDHALYNQLGAFVRGSMHDKYDDLRHRLQGIPEEMEDTIQVGSVVQLKSGGPRMTVEVLRDGLVCCTWFNPMQQTISLHDTWPAECVRVLTNRDAEE